MFQLRYAASELRRRAGRTILTALGLAAGVGLVIGIIGVSQGLDDAQATVLAPLKKVGTDVLVTRVAGATTPSSTADGSTTSTTAAGDRPPAGRGGGGGFFGVGPGGGGPGSGGPGGGGNAALNQADTNALLQENDSVVTDLSKLGPAGTQFTHDFFLGATLISFPQEAVDQVAKLPGVTSAVGGLTLLVQHESGTVPNQVVNVQTGGDVATPAPLTADERAQMRQCLIDNGAFQRRPDAETPSTTPGQTTPGQTTPPPDGTGGQGQRGGTGPLFGAGGDDSAFQKCQPERFKQFTTAIRNIQQIVNPPATDTTATTYTAAGVDPASPKAGLVTADQVTAGRFLNGDAPNEALLNVAYANKKN